MARGRIYTDAEDAIITRWFPDYGPVIATQKLREIGILDRSCESVSSHARARLGLVANSAAPNGYRPAAGHTVGNPHWRQAADKPSRKTKPKQEPGRGRWGFGTKVCELCQRGAVVAGERFCTNCRGRVLTKVRSQYRDSYTGGRGRDD